MLDENKNIKLGDFGLSNYMSDGEFFQSACGSPNFVAPEIISGLKYSGQEVDLWSFGIVLYALLVGSLPFDENNINSLFRKIKKAEYTIPLYISQDAKDLIQRLLNPDPIARLTAQQAKRHPWFAGAKKQTLYTSSRYK